MRNTLLTPELARAVGAALQRIAIWWRQLREQLAALAKRVAETTRHLVRFAARTRARVRTDRPAWASPYGPALKGHR
ncbi:hypothetical protein [Streptomyces prunicolor]|uniref:hypothetical protein n=1 Tax=Streptomyces prunicolor TaxID=67348 RepID=UPI00036EE308|nr:hypothetical protein [Streptomyces prunicolor]